MTDRKGDWMRMYSGVKFYPADPRPEDVKAIDIAHHCAMLTRYTGAIHVLPGEDYTVAEHQILIAQALRRDGYSEDAQLLGLTHDAVEMVVNDQSRPYKVCTGYYDKGSAGKEVVAKVDRAVQTAIWGTGGAPPLHALVKAYDQRIVVDEMRALFPPEHWWDVHAKDFPNAQTLEPLGVEIRKWPAHRAEIEYLRLLKELCVAVGREEFVSWR